MFCRFVETFANGDCVEGKNSAQYLIHVSAYREYIELSQSINCACEKRSNLQNEIYSDIANEELTIE